MRMGDIFDGNSCMSLECMSEALKQFFFIDAPTR